VVTDRPVMHRIDYCGHPVWDPHAATSELIGVDFRGEAEWSRGRTLALYPSEAAAEEVVDDARDAIAVCPDDPGGEGYGTSHTLLDLSLGDQSVVWTDTYWSSSEGEQLHDTGLTVYHLVRVGRAVLASYEYGEGNGSAESRQRGIAEATAAERPLVELMRGLESGDKAVLTHKGVGPYRIGMSAEELIAAGGPLDADQADPCSPLIWTDSDGLQIKGAIATGTGLAYLTVEDGVTSEGVSMGTPLDALAAAYPDLEGDDAVARVALRDTGNYYRFELDDSRVSWLALVDLDQHCVS
jgi:hypothetical protein